MGNGYAGISHGLAQQPSKGRQRKKGHDVESIQANELEGD
jgi:hypothetical protein